MKNRSLAWVFALCIFGGVVEKGFASEESLRMPSLAGDFKVTQSCGLVDYGPAPGSVNYQAHFKFTQTDGDFEVLRFTMEARDSVTGKTYEDEFANLIQDSDGNLFSSFPKLDSRFPGSLKPVSIPSSGIYRSNLTLDQRTELDLTDPNHIRVSITIAKCKIYLGPHVCLVKTWPDEPAYVYDMVRK